MIYVLHHALVLEAADMYIARLGLLSHAQFLYKSVRFSNEI